MFYRDERLALFIDRPNLYAASRTPAIDIDDKLLRGEFMRRGRLVRASFCTVLIETQKYSPGPAARRLALLQRIRRGDDVGAGVLRRGRAAQGQGRPGRGARGRRDGRGVACGPSCPVLGRRRLPIGGGGGVASGARVSVVSTVRSNPPKIAGELRRQADTFIELGDLKKVIGRQARPPAPAAEAAQAGK